MQFKLSINKDRIYYDENIRMICTIDKSDGQTKLAGNFECTNQLIINIYDSNNNLCKSIKGNQAEFRQIPPNRDMMLTGVDGEFTPELDKEYNLNFDLFNYSDPIPSGEYSIQLQIYSLDEKEIFETNKAPLTILPKTMALGFDSIRYDDEEGSKAILSAQLYEDHIQIHHSPCAIPYNSNFRFTFDHKCNGGQVIICESNIPNSKNPYH